MLFLCSDGPLATRPVPQLGNTVVAVHVVGEELCSRVRVGDRVLATGSRRLVGGGGGGSGGRQPGPAHAQLPCVLGVQVGGCFCA